jgi:hypothetical protein
MDEQTGVPASTGRRSLSCRRVFQQANIRRSKGLRKAHAARHDCVAFCGRALLANLETRAGNVKGDLILDSRKLAH